VFGCDEEQFSSWLEEVCQLCEKDAQKVSAALAEKAKKMLIV
jgi:hypothetical protein